MFDNAHYQASALARIDVAQGGVHSLPADGPIRAVLTDEYVEQWRNWVRENDDLHNALWPPLLVYAMMPWHSPEQLRLLDDDVRSIRDHPTSDSDAAVRWLFADPSEPRLWRAGFFETCARAKALTFANDRVDCSVAFDVPLPNGRNVDIVLSMSERQFFLECTVITESDEDQEVHAAWLDARKDDPDLLLARPGQFDPPAAKGPSPYYDANRIYMKVFDKLQRNGDPAKTQTSDDHPNLVLLSCFPTFGSPLPFSPAIGWALDELFAGQPNMGSVKQMPPMSSVPDISLSTFLSNEWPGRWQDLLPCPSRLGGVIIFNCLGFQEARVNYNAREQSRIGHAEMALLERVFLPVRGWENLHPWPGQAPPNDTSD